MRSFLSSLVPWERGMGEMQSELEKIHQNLEDLVQQKDALGLIERIGVKPSSGKIPTTSLVDEYGVYGRDADKEAIIKLLLSDDPKGRRLDVIPIVGLPGVGKTTLAQSVYDGEAITNRFDFKAWVYVSKEFNYLKATKGILQNLITENCDNMSADQLHTKLREKLKEKKVLVVLDDVWSETPNEWDFLLKPFVSAKHGSKILVTTRHERVASVKGTVRSHRLEVLSEEDCWVVLKKHAFVDGDSSQYPDLQEIGRQIAKKCQGLPLAARALGDHLRCSEGRTDYEYWETILNSNLWDESNNEILPALGLSYSYLPLQLKQCFAYCGMFGKGSEIPKEMIVLLWMAEGFLGDEKMKEEGDRCFTGLVSRSLFRLSNHYPSCFVMHDLLWDLAKFVAGDFCCVMKGADSRLPNERTRHLFGFEMNSLNKWDRRLSDFEMNRNSSGSIFKASKLRSLLVDLRKLQKGFLNDALGELKHLRVLLLISGCSLDKLPDSVGSLKHLRLLWLDTACIERLPETMNKLHNLQALLLNQDGCGRRLTKLPDWIGKLKHLRCLSLQETAIERLPESASDLCNLETLDLRGCWKLVELPANMMKLTNLCTLNLQGCRRLVALPATMMKLTNLCNLDIGDTGLQSMPLAMGKLVKLKQLSDFFLSAERGSSIKELGNLKHLRGELRIWNLQNIGNVEYASAANLKGKRQLEKLKLTWDGDTDGSLHHGILEQLRPHTNIKSITIVGYGGDSFPKWVHDSSSSNLVSLHFEGCKNLCSLPPLGHLSCLEDLSIIGSDKVTVIGPEFYGGCSPATKPFASLKTLELASMTELQHWQVEDGAFSVLQHLHVSNCPNLTTMPSNFPSVITLDMSECRLLPSSLPICPVIQKMHINLRRFYLSRLDSGLYSLTVDSPVFQQAERMGLSPPDFEHLEIADLDSLDFPLNSYLNLKSLDFVYCVKLKTFSLESRLLSLTSLYLLGCYSLQSLPESMPSLLPSLRKLKIINCQELEFFPQGGLPSALQSLKIDRCDKLIANRMQWDLQRQLSLSKFKIEDCKCQDVESFPEEKLLPSTLTSLVISDFVNLKSLDYKGLQHLTSLTKLEILRCKNLKSLQEEGLPASLSYLTIWCLDNLESLDCKGFQHLTSLTKLVIRGGSNLQSLSGLGQLSALSSLEISCLPNLKSLDDIQHLTSLRELYIESCDVLQSFPDEGLPPSLSSLRIYSCPLMAKRCEKEKGDYWGRICHIHYIKIDGEKIN